MTVWRVFGGFILATVLAVPLGIAMGAYKPVEAFFEPFVSFARYLPASAFIPLLILWAGIGEMQKLLVIFIGSFFQIVLMVAVSVGATRRDLVEAAYTLGATASGVVRRVLLPSSAPAIAETLRLVLGWAWTYVIVAELIGASSGIGHMITDSQALLNTGQIIFGIIVIGVIGLVSDFLFKWSNQRAFPGASRECRDPRQASLRDEQARIEGVGRVFPGVRGRAPTEALQPTSLAVADNDFITILGPSGCGKSTLLRIVAGLDPPTTGRVLLDGAPVAAPGADRGMVFQSYTLFPWLTVRENVCFGLRERGMPAAQQDEVARRWLARVDLDGLRGSLSEDAFRRHAAAHGDRTRTGERSQDPAAGRAFRRARQPDTLADAGTVAVHLGSRAQDRALRHARHRGSHLHGEPRRRDERAARAGQGRGAGRDYRTRATTR